MRIYTVSITCISADPDANGETDVQAFASIDSARAYKNSVASAELSEETALGHEPEVVYDTLNCFFMAWNMYTEGLKIQILEAELND